MRFKKTLGEKPSGDFVIQYSLIFYNLKFQFAYWDDKGRAMGPR